VLTLDEPSETEQVLQLIGAYGDIRWRVIVNDRDHEWRLPARAINVGIRNAIGDRVMICSPEAAFETNVPDLMMNALRNSTNAAVLGCVQFSTFARLEENGGSVERTSAEPDPGLKSGKATILKQARMYYGSIGIAREALVSVGGYDESLTKWGGDDDNLRIRLKRSGLRIICSDKIRILHLSFEPRLSRWQGEDKTRAEIDRMFTPVSIKANPGGWGEDFSRVVYDWTAADA
jgi:hypothetical protein